MYCNKCGKKNPEGSKFCKYCGTKYDATYEATKPTEHKSSSAGAWFFSIVVLLVIIGAIYLFTNSSSSSNSSNSLPSIPTNRTDSTNTNAAASFKADYKNAFISSCVREGGNDSSVRTVCTCTANYLVANYTVSQLTRMDEEYSSTGVLPQEIVDAASTCVSY